MAQAYGLFPRTSWNMQGSAPSSSPGARCHYPYGEVGPAGFEPTTASVLCARRHPRLTALGLWYPFGGYT